MDFKANSCMHLAVQLMLSTFETTFETVFKPAFFWFSLLSMLTSVCVAYISEHCNNSKPQTKVYVKDTCYYILYSPVITSL